MAGKIIVSPELIKTHGAPDLLRMFSPAIKAGPFIFVSGTAAQDRSQDIRGQARQVFDYIATVLVQAHYSLGDVIKVQTFIKNLADYPSYNEVRRAYFPQNPPASTTVVADFVLPGMLVEVEAIAYKENG